MSSRGGTPPFGRTVPGNRWDLLDGVWPDPAPLVSVVVVHHRQPRELERTLAALERQTHPAARLEVLVVDDGSPEPPVVPPGVTLLRQEDHGFRAAAARDLGARSASGDVLCFLDADTAPEPEYVAELSRLPAVAPEAVTVGRRRHADLSAVPVSACVELAAPAAELPAPAWLPDAYARIGDLLAADDRSYRFVISAVMACSAWFYGEVGGFDASFDAYGGEDWEWAHRAWQAGAILAHVPGAVAWHDGPDWAGREVGDARSRVLKNAESLRLADLVPVPGSRGRAVRSAGVDVVVLLGAADSAAAAYLCVDSVLVELPEARVVVPDRVAPLFAADARVVAASSVAAADLEARVEIEFGGPVRAGPGLREAVDRLAAGGLGTLELTGFADETLARISSRRAMARVARWGDPALFATRRERLEGLEPVVGEPELEAWFGGWG